MKPIGRTYMTTQFTSRQLLWAATVAVFSFRMLVQGAVGNPYDGIYQSFATFTVNSSSDTFDGTQGGGVSHGSLGTLTTLALTYAEVDTYKNGGGNIYNGGFFYEIQPAGTAQPFSGGFSYLNLPFGYDNLLGTAGNQSWTANGQNINLLSGLTAGSSYELEIFWNAGFNGTGGSGTWYDSNGSANYDLSFMVSAVPEPITLALPLFGGLVLTAGLARRFIPRRTTAAA